MPKNQKYSFKLYIKHRIGIELVFLLYSIIKTQKSVKAILAPPCHDSNPRWMLINNKDKSSIGAK